MAGLERAARLAGEAFGHEDMPGLPHLSGSFLSMLTAALAGLVAITGLTVFILR